MYSAYFYLGLAIVAEVIATSSLKATEELTRPLPTLIMVVGYGFSFYFMTLALRTLPLGVTYAFWSGLGIVLITILGAIRYNEQVDWPAAIGMGLIVAGVVVINVFSRMVKH